MKTYEERVQELQKEGLTRSDAQGVTDAEIIKGAEYVNGTKYPDIKEV